MACKVKIRGIQKSPLSLSSVNYLIMAWELQSAFLAEASTLLILLAGAILLYRSFREKYLVPWIAGWTLYSLSKLFITLAATGSPTRLWTALACASFVLAAGLF